VEQGKWKLTFKPKKPLPVADWMKQQGRFKHLFRADNSQLLESIQQQVDENWQRLLERCGE
jgi:pyruvate ferredoxin oxidoreductase beta subunit